MAKYKVLKRFRDTHTKDIYEIDQEIEMTKKRAAEVEKNLDSSFLEILEKIDQKAKDDPQKEEQNPDVPGDKVAPKAKESAEIEKEETKVTEGEAK